MRNTLTVPGDALEYVLLQRTELQALNRKLFRKLGISYYPSLCRLECRLRGRSIAASFLDSLVEDYGTIRKHLPERVDRILDIGCGVAGIDALLNDHYRAAGSEPAITLLDKTSIAGEIFYDFHDQGAFYNSLDVARNLLKANGVPSASITLLLANDEGGIDTTEPIDLVISLISWGFHYPVETYVKEVHRVLAPGGSLILDVRRGTGGREVLDSVFRETRAILERKKYDRVLARK